LGGRHRRPSFVVAVRRRFVTSPFAVVVRRRRAFAVADFSFFRSFAVFFSTSSDGDGKRR